MKIILSLPRRVTKRQQQLFKANVEFKTKSKITKRTLAVSEAFGIGVDDEKTFPVFRNFELDLKRGNVLLITGDSGSGKSTLLREISEQVEHAGQKEFPYGLVSNESVNPDPDEILIEGIGKDVIEAISILSMAGLNEAFLMLRKYKQLSDGQKYRYRLAKMIDSEASVWLFDEFAALLDRVTAKVVSYTTQKTARKLGKTLVLATTHEDILLDVKPDVWVRKGFGDSVRVERYAEGTFAPGCSLFSQSLVVERCESKDLKGLERFHYRNSMSAGPLRACFRALINGELAGGIVYLYPHMGLRGRKFVMPELEEIRKKEGLSAYLHKINREVSRISRVVVLPKFRSIGLGAEIVKKTLPLIDTKYVETLAVMAKYNPFFEKAGMKRVELPEDKKFEASL
ncbi:MAG: ATP-binding cassette domain-containing protein, partial [Nitrososphaerales archaeon]